MKQIKQAIKKLKISKHHLDWIAGLLSIPVLLTVIILNLSNLTQKKNTSTNSSLNKPTEKIIIVPQNKDKEQISPQITNSACRKEIGPITITSPEENETVRDNPLCINISYENQNYCSVVWSYRINNGDWSEFSNTSPCIYNAPAGNIKFELKIQSTVAQDQQKTLIRNFRYEKESPATPSASINY